MSKMLIDKIIDGSLKLGDSFQKAFNNVMQQDDPIARDVVRTSLEGADNMNGSPRMRDAKTLRNFNRFDK